MSTPTITLDKILREAESLGVKHARYEPLRVAPDGIPAKLKATPRWLAWKLEARDGKNGKLEKIPYDPRTERRATGDGFRDGWSSFGEAIAAYQRGGFAGIGFAFDDADRICGIDLDDCRHPDGRLEAWAAEIVAAIDGYTEVSPSGTGVKIYVEADLQFDSGRGGKNFGHVELYRAGRWFAVTGACLNDGTPVDVEDRAVNAQSLLDSCYRVWPTKKKESPGVSYAAPPETDKTKRAAGYLATIEPTACGAGECDKRTFRVACELVLRFDLSQDEAFPLLKEWANRGEHSWSDWALERKLQNAAKQPGPRGERYADDAKESTATCRINFDTLTSGKPKGGDGAALADPPAATDGTELPWPEITPIDDEPTAPEFPLEVLPKRLAGLCQEIAVAMNCPVDFPAANMIALASGAIGYSRRLEIKPGHTQSASLFMAVVGGPGTAKTPVLQLLSRPINAKQSEMFAEHRERLDEWEAKPAKERGRRPSPNRCVVSDITVESLGQTLADNPRGVCLIRDELTAFVLGMNQYKGGKGNDRQFFLSLWSNSPIIIDRKGDAARTGTPVHVAEPFTTIVGGIQPAVVSQLGGDGVDDGFFDRFLVSYPETMPAVGETWSNVPTAALATWDFVVEKLLSLDDAPAKTCLMPGIVRLTESGRGEWKAFTDRHAAEMNNPRFPEHFRGPWVKLVAYCGRLALVIHHLLLAAGETVSDDVDGDAMARAATLIDYFKGHLRKVHGKMDTAPGAAGVRKIVDWIRRNGSATFSKREVHQSLKKTFGPNEMDAALRIVADLGYIRRVPPPTSSKPGPKGDLFEVNPNL